MQVFQKHVHTNSEGPMSRTHYSWSDTPLAKSRRIFKLITSAHNHFPPSHQRSKLMGTEVLNYETQIEPINLQLYCTVGTFTSLAIVHGGSNPNEWTCPTSFHSCNRSKQVRPSFVGLVYRSTRIDLARNHNRSLFLPRSPPQTCTVLFRSL